jgi:hypothetical protein
VYTAGCICMHDLHRAGHVHLCKFSKKKKFGQPTWAREAGRHLEGNQRPNLTQNTQKT